MLANGMIAPEDLHLVQLIDEPANIVDEMNIFYEERSIEPCEEERHRMLYL